MQPLVDAIVQARMTSKRLPGKVLLPLAGIPVLRHVVTRLEKCVSVGRIIVATSTESSDDPIAQLADEIGIHVFRGSLDDVLGRYRQASTTFGVSDILRITADCPAIDPAIIDEVVVRYFNGSFDYFGLGGEFPNGLDCTVISAAALEKAEALAVRKSDREHVGPYIERHPESFRIGAYSPFTGQYHHRWTLDEPEDYQLLTAIFETLFPGNPVFGHREILKLLQDRPELLRVNAGVTRNEGYLKSIRDEELDPNDATSP